jgi:hypothetical protein
VKHGSDESPPDEDVKPQEVSEQPTEVADTQQSKVECAPATTESVPEPPAHTSPVFDIPPIVIPDGPAGAEPQTEAAPPRANESVEAAPASTEHMAAAEEQQPSAEEAAEPITDVAEQKSSALIEFDTPLLAAAQEQVKRWTVRDLATELAVPAPTMLLTYSKMRSNATSKLCENTQFAARHRAINAGPKPNANLLNPADTKATFDKLSKMGNQQCDECITMFLQTVVTESILEEHWLDGAVQRCIKALQEKNNRRCLIDMLKNAKQTKDTRKAVANVYPLNSAAFEAFSKLFSGLLRICSNQEDYLCAYGLLEVGGLYFRLVVRDEETAVDPAVEQDDVMEFLSERICQHPIYHNSALWGELMKSRVPVPGAAATTSTAAGAALSKNPKALLNAVLSEVHSLLFIMLELEVR